jgi:hypothetical protein
MKRIFLIALYFFPTLFFELNAQQSTGPSIELLYEGSRSRQVQIVIFHLPGVVNTIYGSTDVKKIEVSEMTYRNIEKRVKVVEKYSGDSLLHSPYEFIIRNGNGVLVVSTFSLTNIREVFRDITNEFKANRKQKLVKEVLSYVFKCLEIEYQ